MPFLNSARKIFLNKVMANRAIYTTRRPIYNSRSCSEHSVFLLNSPPIPLCESSVRVSMADLKSTFLKVYSVLKSELLEDPAFEWTHDSRQWVEQVRLFPFLLTSHLLSRSSVILFTVSIFWSD